MMGFRLVREGDAGAHEKRFEEEVAALLNQGWTLAGPAIPAVSREWSPNGGGQYFTQVRWAQPMMKDVL